MYSVTPRVTQAHMQSHTRSQSYKVPHWGLAMGAGSGRQLRKRPPSPHPHSPSAAPPSSRCASAWGGLAEAREQLGLAEAPGAEKPDPDTALGLNKEGGPGAPLHILKVQPSPPWTTHPHPEKAPSTNLGQHLGPTHNTLVLPFWNPVIWTSA